MNNRSFESTEQKYLSLRAELMALEADVQNADRQRLAYLRQQFAQAEVDYAVALQMRELEAK